MIRKLRFALLFIIALSIAPELRTQTFQDFLLRVDGVSQQEKTAVVDSFMTAVPAFPFTEQDSLAHFLYRGDANTLHIPGDANSWNPTAFPMSKISATDLWYRTFIFESDARLDYKFVLNVSIWILDPLNPNKVSGGFGPNSEMAMPGYLQPTEILFRPDIPHGTLNDRTFFSTNLGNTRVVRVYLPPGYDNATASYPVVLFHDGTDYLNLGSADNVLDYLIDQNRIQPVIGVFVPPVNRTPEYAGHQIEAFSAFITDELMPWIDNRYRTEKSAARRAVVGASNGGNISLWLGISHPQVFGLVGAQSTNVESNVQAKFQNSPKQHLKLYIDIGTYDTPILINRVNAFIPVLDAKQYNYTLQRIHEGHSWGNWRAHLDSLLTLFFPAQTSNINTDPSPPNGFHLLQNYPNPFNPATTIAYSLGDPAVVKITIYNQKGRRVSTLTDHRQPAGSYLLRWNGSDSTGKPQPSGIYYCQMQVNRQARKTRKLLLLR